MIKVEITQIEKYKITQEYELIEETEQPTLYRRENNHRYTFEIYTGTYADKVHRNREYRSLIIYSQEGDHANFLVSGNYSYEFITMNLFNSNLYRSNELHVCKSQDGEDGKFYDYPFNNETLLMLLKEFDSLTSSKSYNTFTKLNEMNSKLNNENVHLRKLFKDLKRRINESIKGLRG